MTNAATDANLSLDHLNELIATLSEWSRQQPWTKAQMAAWRLHWFGRTPEDDERAREECDLRRADELARGFDRYAPREREPFTDWPNGQGTYD